MIGDVNCRQRSLVDLGQLVRIIDGDMLVGLSETTLRSASPIHATFAELRTYTSLLGRARTKCNNCVHTIYLRPRGGRKLALQNGKVEGSEVGKNTALFLEAGVKSPLYVALCPDPPAREEREERRKDERQRGEREREEREMRKR